MKVKNFLFGLWGTFWVWVDELGKILGGMTLKEFAKFIGKVVLYGLSAIGWIVIIYAMLVVGYAV